MPINVFGNSDSNDNGNRIHTSWFAQKSYLRSNYIESNIEKDIELKNQFRIKVYLILLAYGKLVVKITLIIYATILK